MEVLEFFDPFELLCEESYASSSFDPPLLVLGPSGGLGMFFRPAGPATFFRRILMVVEFSYDLLRGILAPCRVFSIANVQN